MGCVSSRHNRRKSTLKEESSEKRIDDWIQPEVGFDRSSSRGDAKVRSQMFSSGRFYAHQIGKKILENPEIADHVDPPESRTRPSSAVLNPDLAIDPNVVIKPKLDRWNSRDSKLELIESEKLRKKKTSVVVTKDTELKQVSAGWPIWLVSVAGEALVDWSPRRANTFEKLDKVTSFF